MAGLSRIRVENVDAGDGGRSIGGWRELFRAGDWKQRAMQQIETSQAWSARIGVCMALVDRPIVRARGGGSVTRWADRIDPVASAGAGRWADSMREAHTADRYGPVWV